jgi:hypothetical protein
MGQQLSQAGEEALKAVKALPPAEQATVVSLASADLAAKIAQKVSTAPPEQLAKASSEIDQGIKTATHGFKQVTAPDGTAAIEVKITRPTGEDVTCLLSEGARGKWYGDLADYGKDKLQGATLLTHADFQAVVESLYKAINDQKVANDALQTDDAALKQAYQIVTEGVRRGGGFSWAKFDLDSGGAVVGRRVYADGYDWIDDDLRNGCALFVSPPAESKKS